MITGTTTAWLGVNNEAKELFGSGSPGGGSMVPTWLITATQAWTVPVTGNYRLICIGKGGDGGTGYSTASYGLYAYYYKFYEACPGAGGGVAIGDQRLNSGDMLRIMVTDEYSSLGRILNTSIDTMLKATAGGKGYNADIAKGREREPSLNTSPGQVPAGGSASGAWLKYGYTGNSPKSPDTTIHYVTYGTHIFDSNPGGDVGTIILQPALNYNAGIGAFTSSAENGTPVYAFCGDTYYEKWEDVPDGFKSKIIPGGGMAGAGGASGGIGIYTSSGSSSYSYGAGGGAAGKGGIGAVLIQFLG